MKRYAVIDHSIGLAQGLYDDLSEAIAAAARLQDAGKQVGIHDTQGTAGLVAGVFDVKDAEYFLGRPICSATMKHPLPIADILTKANETKPEKTKYHWDIDS